MATVAVIFLLLVILGCKSLIQRYLYACILLAGGTPRLALVAYSLLFLSGVVVHELAHFFMAAVMGVRSGQVSLFPDIWSGPVTGRVRMGSVQIEKTDFIRSSLVGAAPLIFGLTLIVLLTSIMFNRLGIPLGQVDFKLWLHLQIGKIGWIDFGLLYLVMSISNTLFVSKEDTRAWPGMIIGFGLLALLLLITGSLARFTQSVYTLVEMRLWQVAFVLAFVSLIDAILAAGLAMSAALISRVVRKRIVYA